MVKKRIYAIQTDTAGVFHFRVALPFAHLDPERYEVSWGPHRSDLDQYDVVVGLRLAGHDPTWLELCANPDVLCVYDIDDDLTNVDPENEIPYAIYHPLAEGTKANIAAADIVTVPNRAFADRMRPLNERVAILPICIPNDMPEWPVYRAGPVTVGWAGSMFKAQDWPGIAEMLAALAQEAPEVAFHMMGADYTRGLVPRTRVTGWSSVNAYYRGLDFHIGIAPLAHSPFNDLKCHTKLVEYGARQIVPVASAIGQNVEWIEHGVNGMLIHDDRDWLPCLKALIEDADLRERMAGRAQESSREWVIGRQIHRWETVYEGGMPL